MMTPHGPDGEAFERASTMDVSTPTRMPDDSLAFMFESTYVIRLTDWALQEDKLDTQYIKAWHTLKKHFNPTNPIPE